VQIRGSLAADDKWPCWHYPLPGSLSPLCQSGLDIRDCRGLERGTKTHYASGAVSVRAYVEAASGLVQPFCK